MRDSTMQILEQHKIKADSITDMRTYGLIVDPEDITAPRNLNNTFGMGLYVKHRGYIQLDISDCTKKDLIHLRTDITELIKGDDNGKI